MYHFRTHDDKNLQKNNDREWLIILKGPQNLDYCLLSCIGGGAALQLSTAFCIVNLALWEDETKETSLLANINGAYLVTLLGSGNPAMQEACCWALSNLLPQGRKILISQGIVAGLIGLFASPYPDVCTAAIQCSTHLVRTSSEAWVTDRILFFRIMLFFFTTIK